jgi:predicted nucleotidyltransferase
MTEQADHILRCLGEQRAALERLGVRRIGLFGSAARGMTEAGSDLDFVVELRTKSFDAYMDVKFLLEDVFGRPVDLVLLDSVKPRLKPTILAETVYAPGLEGLP